jgi:hypothetical protein
MIMIVVRHLGDVEISISSNDLVGLNLQCLGALSGGWIVEVGS